MNRIHKLLLGASIMWAPLSCTENEKIPAPPIIKAPEDPYANLDTYEPLKNYIDLSTDPDFKLGVGVDPVGALTDAGGFRTMVTSNFNDIVAGNAMKYASVVRNNGNMDFTNVIRFVDAARDAGLSVYGHTLVWHAQQRPGYLNGLIAPKAQPATEEFGAYALKLTNATVQELIYGAQVMYDLAAPLTPGTVYTLKFTAKATVACSPEIFTMNSDRLPDTQGYPGPVAIGTDWAEASITFTPTHDQIDRFSFNFGTFATTILVDNISLTAEGSTTNLIANGDFEAGNIAGWFSWGGVYESLSVEGATVPRTAEEKLEILTAELDRWIGGMMEATDGYVKAWDLVNEAMDDGNAYALKTDPTGAKTDDFYWQDHMGRDFARVAARIARQKYTELYGRDDLLLFVNDYNLEATYNRNDKCRGMIAMVKYWESDGVTRIDGLGTQMHISYHMDPAEQKRREDAIVTMFQLMAETGKLVKVTELDMGIDNASGQAIPLAGVTADQHRKMADFYNFIVTKYFEIVPAAQRYGITHWTGTDNASEGGWRANSPIGLWTTDYKRKPAYAGFANGLAGK